MLFSRSKEIWPFEETPVPKIAPDLALSSGRFAERGLRFRTRARWIDPSHSYDGHVDIGELNRTRQTLWTVLTDEQKATLYWYGFIEEKRVNLQGDRWFRIHVDGGTGLASLMVHNSRESFYATTGVCCYVVSAPYNEINTMSNLMAIRADAAEFARVGCSNPTVEAMFDREYPRRNS